jgi:oxygen-independent coproporphyrinogen-3 oxidase
MFNLTRFNCPAPRYTSYPTAPNWKDFAAHDYVSLLRQDHSPLSLYVHIPFCASMCLFCGCSVILNRKEEKEVEYVDYLLKEISLLRSLLPHKPKVAQLHFGGGTPTKLANPLLERIMTALHESFDISGEIAIEIDPRTATNKLPFLKSLGFNRVSFGVQDTDPAVQEAVRRRQSEALTRATFLEAKALGFQEINIDLIYGLPKQTQESFHKTVSTILELKPDRIALFSYAKIPWLKEHQKAIPDSDLPSTEEKFAIYTSARRRFIEAGYVAIGMDHFALSTSELARSYHQKTLSRNFQGYTVKSTETLLGLGVTSIGYTQHSYTQNHKDLKTYYEALSQNTLPTYRGHLLTLDDHIRKWVIHTLMCRFELDKQLFQTLFHMPFDSYFKNVDLSPVSDLIEVSEGFLRVNPQGELLIRNIAMLFDAYLKPVENHFSQSI